MTAPTITYGQGYINDCTTTTSWVENVTLTFEAAGYVNCIAGDLGKYVCKIVGGVCDATIGLLTDYNNTTRIWVVAPTTTATTTTAGWTIGLDANGAGAPDGTGTGTARACILSAARTFSSDGDIFTLTGTTADTSAEEYQFVELDITNISDITYPTLTVRFKTSAASAGLQAQAVMVYSDGSTSTHALGYSQTWKVTAVSPHSASSTTISKIRFYAIEDAAANANGTYTVYYDFSMIHIGTFTWPYSPETVEVSVSNRYADLTVPGRIGDISQFLGAPNEVVVVRGSIDTSTSWHLYSTFDESYLYSIMHWLTGTAFDFQWFTSDRITCKVTLRNLRVWSSGSGGNVVNYEWTMQYYHAIGGENKWYEDRFYGK